MAALTSTESARLRLAQSGVTVDVDADGSVVIDQFSFGDVCLSADEWRDILTITGATADPAHDRLVSMYERELHRPRRRA